MSGERRFERWSSSYDRSSLQRLLFNRVHEAVFCAAGELAAGQAILDVGCGTGRLLREAHRRWPDAQVIGVDLSPGMIEQARQLAAEATFLVASAEDLPLPTASIDLAVSTMSFHHWADQVGGIREVVRVLRPSGRFLLADLVAPHWLRRIGVTLALSARDRGRALSVAGLTVIEETPILSRHVLLTVGQKEEGV